MTDSIGSLLASLNVLNRFKGARIKNRDLSFVSLEPNSLIAIS